MLLSWDIFLKKGPLRVTKTTVSENHCQGIWDQQNSVVLMDLGSEESRGGFFKALVMG